jgi:diaminopimelate epimerase
VSATGPVFLKGHGTENDFVVVLDPDGTHGLTPGQVRDLCDRRRGLGADGVLRAVPGESGWFMDYRNANGSTAEMCGNGARLFALALRDAGLVTEATFPIETLGGVRTATVDDGAVTVSMGRATTVETGPEVRTERGVWSATPVWVPNPHAVAWVDALDDAGPLTEAPAVTPDDLYPEGVNVEFVVGLADDHIALRVHERGVGETRSCGTGAVAAAWAWRRRTGRPDGSIRVDVPGGTLHVTEHPDGELDLRGPVVVVARGTLDARWWKERA